MPYEVKCVRGRIYQPSDLFSALKRALELKWRKSDQISEKRKNNSKRGNINKGGGKTTERNYGKICRETVFVEEDRETREEMEFCSIMD